MSALKVVDKLEPHPTQVDATLVAAQLPDSRLDALKLARRYVSGARYCGASRVVEVARCFGEFLDGAKDHEDLLARKSALTEAVSHLCRPKSMVRLEAVVAAAEAFHEFIAAAK